MTAESPPLVFITGASSGIGQALAARFYRDGFRLALAARRTAEVEQWLHSQQLDAARCAVYAVDVRDVVTVVQAARDCIARHGLPDIVIANAGIGAGFDTSQAADLEVMRAIYETNVIGMAATFHPFVGPMREHQHRHIGRHRECCGNSRHSVARRLLLEQSGNH